MSERLESPGAEAPGLPGGRRVVLAGQGTLGDLHPFLALAGALKRRGHRPLIATDPSHRGRVEARGIEFRPMRPDTVPVTEGPGSMPRYLDPRRGLERIVREVFMPALREGLDDLRAAARGADLLVTHTMAFAGPLVAELDGIPWASSVLSPAGFLSRHDPPVFSQMPWLRHLRPLGPRFFGPLLRYGASTTLGWVPEVGRLRAELGLPPGRNPLCEDFHAPWCVLAQFSAAFARPQPDWPAQAVQVGFPFLDDEGEGLPAGLGAFLDGGSPPIVFTLGSSAVHDAGRFYAEGLAATRRLGRRAVLLVGRDPRNRHPGALPAWAFEAEYAPHSALFPRAAAVVHQGGIGTTAQALRAARPMLVVPRGFDQHDNAARAVRLGVARSLSRGRIDAARAASALRRVLGDPRIAARSEEIGRAVRCEDGTSAACDRIERRMDEATGSDRR